MGFTVSFAPMTSVTSVSLKSSFISSISKTTLNAVSSGKKHYCCYSSYCHRAQRPPQGARCIDPAYDPRQGGSQTESKTEIRGSLQLRERWRQYPNVDSLGSKHGANFGYGILRLRNSHSIAHHLLGSDRSEFIPVMQALHQRFTNMTLSAFANASTVSSTVVFVIVPSILCVSDVVVGAIPPKRTFVRERFIATH